MRIYNKTNVWDAAVKRFDWLFEEFPNVVVSFSGGKDSTIIFHMALEAARRANRLPLNVLFVDQEGEWESTIEQIRYVMYHPDVKPYWLQVPLKLFNATSHDQHWLMTWDESQKDDWVHPYDPISLLENVYAEDRFHAIFNAALKYHFGDTPTANIGGVRAEESTSRLVGLTHQITYKWVTWGKKLDEAIKHYTFYPIYDWSYTDVWKAIAEHDWPYSKLYDLMHQYGVTIMNMRVSNLFHETAVHQLFYLQEFEPETYAKLANRLKGVDMAGKLGADDYFVRELPFMFESWREYRDYLLEHLIDNPDWRKRMARRFAKHDYELGEVMGDVKYKAHVQSILAHDWEGVKVVNFRNSKPTRGVARRLKKEREAANV